MRLLIFILVAGLGLRVERAGGIEPPPARANVIIAEDREAIDAFNVRPERVEALFQRGLLALTGKSSPEAAWRGLVSTRDIVGIKVVSGPGPGGTRPAVVGAAVRGLLAAGVPARNVIVWDKRLADLRRGGFVELAQRLGVRAQGALESGYDEAAHAEFSLLGKPVWGDHEFGKTTEETGRRSFVSRLVSKQLTKIINLTPLLNHNLAGVSGNAFTLAMDSVDNTLRFENSPEYLAEAVAEIFALEAVGDKAVLHVTDALICQYQGEELSRLHYSAMLGQLRFSKDPVALDILSIREIEQQRALKKLEAPKPNLKIYANCALLELGVDDPRRIDVHLAP